MDWKRIFLPKPSSGDSTIISRLALVCYWTGCLWLIFWIALIPIIEGGKYQRLQASGPWEKYQKPQASGPWQNYQNPQSTVEMTIEQHRALEAARKRRRDAAIAEAWKAYAIFCVIGVLGFALGRALLFILANR
jgi:hypothetical protein